MQQILDEIAEKIENLSDEELDKLSAIVNEKKSQSKKNGKNGFVHPNTIWVKENRAEYQGKYVALDEGKLVGTGKNYPEALADAKKRGIEKPMITYIFPLDSKPFGGW